MRLRASAGTLERRSLVEASRWTEREGIGCEGFAFAHMAEAVRMVRTLTCGTVRECS